MDIRYVAAAGYDLYPCDEESVIIETIAICAPDAVAYEYGTMSLSAKEVLPSLRIQPPVLSFPVPTDL